MNESLNSEVIKSDNPTEISRRIAVFPKKVPARFETEKPQEKLVMTFPNLIIREAICFQLVVIVCALLALFIDAPLEELANPTHTPNPAKAPWYFLGLQELLHSFPPLVAGVVIPGMVIVALIIIPYFETNIIREGFWEKNQRKRFYILSAGALAVSAISAVYQTLSITVPTLILYSFVVLPYFVKREDKWISWLRRRSIAEWIMIWFIALVIILTFIGTYLRGPGWSLVLPWE